MNIYLISRYSRRDEMVRRAKDLERKGHTVTSRWIREVARPGVKDDDDLDPAERALTASQNLHDLNQADTVIAFTEFPPNPGQTYWSYTRGGRHIEFGYAVAKNKKLYVVGPLENCFYYLPKVTQVDYWYQLLDLITAP